MRKPGDLAASKFLTCFGPKNLGYREGYGGDGVERLNVPSLKYDQ